MSKPKRIIDDEEVSLMLHPSYKDAEIPASDSILTLGRELSQDELIELTLGQ